MMRIAIRLPTNSRANLEAIGLVILAGLLFVGMNAVVKGMAETHHPVMLIWARYFFHVLTVLVLFPHRLGGVMRTPQLGVQIGRSVLLLGSTAANFMAFVYLPLGDVAAITFSSPIIVAALAVMLLKERVEAARWLAIGAGFLGAIMVIRPLGADVNIGAALAFTCAASYALYQVSTRMVREAEPIISLFFSGIVGMIGVSLIVPFFWTMPSLTEWLIFATIGATGSIGHLLIIMALQRAEASRISPFTYMQLIWAMLASFLFFGDVPDSWTVIGAAVIAGSGLWVYRLDLAEQRRARAMLGS
jgi:drug/metabolite transporter (DMT)-like permease